ncbi:MAG: hypothetical protein AAFV49_01260 [Pseudomonadota bacterium]
MRKFIVISDLHIVPEGQLSRGLDTTARLEATLADIRQPSQCGRADPGGRSRG